jgi:NodT family efflux transporter outer membrane factor (OMF) lipoprotein
MSERSLLTTAAAAMTLVFAVTGCTSARYAERAETVVEIPDAWAETPVEALEKDGFCSDFGLPELDALYEDLWQDNLNLRAAFARHAQAEAIATSIGATRWPTADFQASASRARSPGPPPAGTMTDNRFSLTAAAAYELDLWGRLAANRKAASYDAAAMRADVEAMAISLTAELTDAYFDVLHQREKLALLDEQIATTEQFRELVMLRLSSGTATALDVNQQEQQLHALRAQRAGVEAQLATASQRMAVLVGQAPQTDRTGPATALPSLPAAPEAGLPASLLTRRPDLRAAMMRLEAADARIAVAAADRLPNFRLSASLFLQATSVTELIDDVFWSLTGNLIQPIFDGGRRKAELERTEAVAEERLYLYGQTLLQALFEVQSALVLEAQRQEVIDELAMQLERAELAIDLARERYRQGSLDYLRVLTTLQGLQQLQHSLLDARRLQLSHRVQLCRALGGGWTQELEAPQPTK